MYIGIMRAFATGRVKNSTVQLIVDMGWMDALCRETFRPYCTLALRRPSFTVLYEHRSQSIPVLFHGGVLCVCACVSSNHFISRFCKYCIRNALSHTHRGGVKKMTMFLHRYTLFCGFYHAEINNDIPKWQFHPTRACHVFPPHVLSLSSSSY
jgi:hypothetical protein